jgi:predicted nucleotidyltransferase component of viral defense system
VNRSRSALIEYTQSTTGFSVRLVEKDCFGSLILGDLLAVTSPPWVFKGGTCLSKVHGNFYRLSEDLDFAYSVPLDASRSQRSKMIAPVWRRSRNGSRASSMPLRGYNDSTQYLAGLRYRSVATGRDAQWSSTRPGIW